MRPLYGLLDAGWKLLRAPLRLVLGDRRVGALLDVFGLRALKARRFVLETTLPDGSSFAYRPHDQCVLDEVFAKRVYGGPEAFRPGEVVVDVGAHIGAFAVLAAKAVGPTGRLIACEPSPDSAALLRENLARNGIAWARLHECAVGASEGHADLYVAAGTTDKDNPIANTLKPSAGRRPVRVSLRTLDAIAADEALTRIDHLKLDIEGAELDALRGGPRALALTRHVMLEIHPDHVDPQAVLSLLESAGFAARVLSRGENSWIVDAPRM